MREKWGRGGGLLSGRWRAFTRTLLLKSAYGRKEINLKNTNKSSSIFSFRGPQSNEVSSSQVLTLDLVQSLHVADEETG